MLLNKVNAQDKRLIQVGIDVEFVLDKLFVDFEAEFVQVSHRQWLASS